MVLTRCRDGVVGLMETTTRKDVLIVDDDLGIRRLLSVAMRRGGLTCDAASDGFEALECVGSTHYRVILTDLMMPRLDGWGFIRELAKIEAVSVDRPVVLVMTAAAERGMQSVEEDAVQAIIPKPFDVKALRNLVQSCVKSRRQRETALEAN